MDMKNLKKNKPIVILGGMGPQASSELVRLVINLATKQFGIRKCEDFPEIILDSIPAPDCIEGTKNEQKLISKLNIRINDLGRLNPLCFCIACNTVHLFINKLSFPDGTLFISMIDEIVMQIKSDNKKKVGLLASPLTINSRLYQNKLKKEKITVILPDNKQTNILNEIIRRVIAGDNLNSSARKLIRIAASLKEKGADCIVLGCTELPLVFSKKFTLPVFNSLEILALKLLKTYYNFDTLKN